MTVFVLALLLGAAPEKSPFPTYATIFDRHAFSRTTVQCAPVDKRSDQLSCEFLGLAVAIETPERWKESIGVAEQDVTGFDAAWAKDETKTIATFKELCPGLAEDRLDQDRRRVALAPFMHGADFNLEFGDRLLTELKGVCECEGSECVKARIKAIGEAKLEVEKSAPECELKTTRWTGTFERKGTSWTRQNPTPTDLCFASETQTLEPRDDRPNRRWTFRTTRTFKPGAAAKDHCKRRPAESTSSAEHFPDFVLHCRVKL